MAKIGIRSYQLYGEFLKYGPDKYKALYKELQDAVNRIKNGEKSSSAVVLDTIMRCLQIEKGE